MSNIRQVMFQFWILKPRLDAQHKTRVCTIYRNPFCFFSFYFFFFKKKEERNVLPPSNIPNPSLVTQVQVDSNLNSSFCAQMVSLRRTKADKFPSSTEKMWGKGKSIVHRTEQTHYHPKRKKGKYSQLWAKTR